MQFRTNEYIIGGNEFFVKQAGHVKNFFYPLTFRVSV